MLVVFLRTLILYALVVLGMRIMGKRQLGELQPSELVTTILISNIATLPIENTNVPLLSGAVPILTLMCFEVILSYLGMKNRRFRTILSGTPRIIIRQGKIDQQELENLRYSVDDLMEQLRVNSIFDVQQVEMAVVETTGQLSVCKKAETLPLTASDLGKTPPALNIPAVVVSDGQLLPQGLDYCGIGEETVRKLAKKQGRELQDIFLMTCTPDQTVYIVEKEKDGKQA
ncbi:MAG: DUF421 domain-containing protein [Oscillospiraceae bacterium]|nr:DUF421 domain-containing protein [Oscillospiraceae bacterium]